MFEAPKTISTDQVCVSKQCITQLQALAELVASLRSNNSVKWVTNEETQALVKLEEFQSWFQRLLIRCSDYKSPPIREHKFSISFATTPENDIAMYTRTGAEIRINYATKNAPPRVIPDCRPDLSPERSAYAYDNFYAPGRYAEVEKLYSEAQKRIAELKPKYFAMWDKCNIFELSTKNCNQDSLVVLSVKQVQELKNKIDTTEATCHDALIDNPARQELATVKIDRDRWKTMLAAMIEERNSLRLYSDQQLREKENLKVRLEAVIRHREQLEAQNQRLQRMLDTHANELSKMSGERDQLKKEIAASLNLLELLRAKPSDNA